MSVQISTRAQRVKPSPTLAVTQKAAELRAAGQNVIGLGAGEPDFDTPSHIKDAAIAAISEGFTKYTAVDGIVELKQAIIDKLARDNQLEYTLDQILVSSGGKQSFFNLAQAMLNDGDEVIIPVPYWVSYPDMVAIAGAEPVYIQAGIEDNFKVNPQQLEAAITQKTRLFIINSPSNPTGVAYTRDDLLALGEVLRKYPHVFIATDDMYEHILWSDEPFCNIQMVCPDLAERIIVLNGVSKAYSMTGWRIGYAAGPRELIKTMKKIQSQSTSNPCSISQKAALAALEGSQEPVAEMLTEFKKRHDFIVARLNEIKGIQCLPSDGAFYAFADVRVAIANLGLKTDIEFAEFLLTQSGVAVVPGSAFGAEGYMRLSFATSMENLTDALSRIESALT